MGDRNMRELIQHIGDAILVVDGAGVVLYANPAAGMFFHRPVEELVGSVFGRPEVQEDLVEVASVSPEGLERIGEMRASRVSWEGKRAFAVVVRDVTERRRAEESAWRARRARTVLSACNRALMNADREEGFLEDVCAQVVEHGGYAMVWIGLKVDDGRRRVRPVACAGRGTDYLDQVVLTWDESEAGRAPTGRAIRTGRSVVCRNLSYEAAGARWGREAIARGFASSIALPLVVDGACIGALSIYASEVDAFDRTEQELLDEMVRDLGHGLETIRGRVARRAAEEEVKRSAERWRATFEAITDTIVLMSPDCRVMEINAAGCALLGVDAGDVVGRLCPDVFGLVECPGPDCPCREAERSGEAVNREHVRAGRDLELVVWPVLSRRGGVEGFVHVLKDVTEEKEARQNLVSFSEKLERLAHVVQELSVARSEEEVFRVAVRAARRLVGASGATFVVREKGRGLCVAEDGEMALCRGRRIDLSGCAAGRAMVVQGAVVVGGAGESEEIRSACRVSSVAKLVAVPVGSPDPVGALSCYWDVPGEVRAEALRVLGALADASGVALENVRVLREIERSKARVRAIYEHLPYAAFVWQRRGQDFVLADCNKSAIEMTRGGAQAFIGKSVRALPHSLPHLEDDLRACLEERRVVRREVTLSFPGRRQPMCLKLSYGFIPGDMVIQHAEDVTEQRHIEEQLRMAHRLESVGRLAGGVAHDFNNLLSVIINYAGFALEELQDHDVVREDLEEVRKAGQRAAALTRQLLAFSRKQVLKPEVLNLNDVVQGIEGMLRRLLGEDIRIITMLADDLGRVEADPGQIEQVIMNLAVNARDAMPQGGTLVIETSNETLDEAYSLDHPPMEPGRFVLLSVSDTGCGMEAEVRQHLFEPFFTTKEPGRGTGLGLATVYGIVKQSGGYVWVYSEPGKGSTFKIYLPRIDMPAEPSVGRRTGGHRGDETILVVEDEEAVRRLTERILTSAGYRVMSASSGEEALRLTAGCQDRIDLLLTDVVMPGMNGRELAERMTQEMPSLAVLFMSGYTDESISHHGVLDSGVRIVSKPFSSAELTQRVRECLDEVRAGRLLSDPGRSGTGAGSPERRR